jgi:hypothetical protein
MEEEKSEMQDRERALIFLHIPKAAGSTLHRIIKRQYPKRAIFTVDGSRIRESIDEFKSLSEEERAEIRCLKGHMPYGLHQYLPRPSVYITVLRDPVDRIISHYYFVLRTPGHFLHQDVISKKMSLEDYVNSDLSSELNNGQVRLLSGLESVDSIYGHGPVSRSVLEAAKANLQNHFFAVGLSERFEESVLLFKDMLGWTRTYFVKENVTQKRPTKSDVSKQILKRIEQYNALDIELYDFAERLFKNMLEKRPVDGRSLKAFQTLNRCYDLAYTPTVGVIKGMVRTIKSFGVRKKPA